MEKKARRKEKTRETDKKKENMRERKEERTHVGPIGGGAGSLSLSPDPLELQKSVRFQESDAGHSRACRLAPPRRRR